MKPSAVAKDLSKARDCCFRLIKFRVRSEKEVRDKLKAKDFSDETIDETVDFLKKTGLLDDETFARLWVSDRIKRPYGPRRLRYELKRKGISKRIIEEALEAAEKEHPQKEAVSEIIERKLKKLKDLPPEKAKARLYGLLLRRGYPVDIVMDSLSRALKRRQENDTDL